MDPDGAGWDVNSSLLAYVGDAVAWANFQRAGGKGREPKPIPRPGANQGPSPKQLALYEEHKRERQRELEVMANGG
jgi:hypothetical protein